MNVTTVYVWDRIRYLLCTFKLDLEKAEEPEIKLPTPLDHWKSKRVPEKHLLLLYWLCQSLWLCGSHLWKILKEMGIPDHLTCLLKYLYDTKEARCERDTCTPMFIAALFIIARTWKQPRCPSADEWIRKLWYIYTMEYYSAIKRNSFESVLMRWMKLEPIIQSEVSQKDKDHYSILTHIYGI